MCNLRVLPVPADETEALTTCMLVQGGWAFLIGSYLQLLECINKHPTSMGMSNPKPISG